MYNTKKYSYLFLALLVLTPATFAKSSHYVKDLSLPARTEIRILQIDKKHKMIQVQSVIVPGEDPSWLKLRDFLQCIQWSPKLEVRQKGEVTKLHSQLIGKTYTLRKQIPTYVYQ